MLSDDVLKRNVYLDRYALRQQSGGSRGGLGDHTLGKKHKDVVIFLLFFRTEIMCLNPPPRGVLCVFLIVADVRYERITPTLDAAAINDATELRFVVPASPDYFTRCKRIWKMGGGGKIILLAVFTTINILCLVF